MQKEDMINCYKYFFLVHESHTSKKEAAAQTHKLWDEKNIIYILHSPFFTSPFEKHIYSRKITEWKSSTHIASKATKLRSEPGRQEVLEEAFRLFLQ
jgi:hypothetical protein